MLEKDEKIKIGGEMLNEISNFEKFDPGEMSRLLETFPDQFPEGRQLAQDVDFGRIDPQNVRNIVICGMGGSAIGGDLVKSYVVDKLEIPIAINREYRLPAFVNEDSLVVGASYSGNTEETLSCFEQAVTRGAQIIAVTTGGKLGEMAMKAEYPLVVLPSGLPPRAALGYAFSPILTIFEMLGFLPDQTDEMAETDEILRAGIESFGLDVEWSENPAKLAATVLHCSLPIIYTDDWFFIAVGVRFRGQINENAKQLAYSAVIPENNHNELVGWKHLYSMSSLIVAVYLIDKGLPPRVRFRMDFLRGVQEELGVQTLDLQSRGEGLLARTFSLIQLGDWISYYMAILNEEDPKPVAVIDRLKGALGQFEEK